MVKVATQTPIISLFLLVLSLETSFIPSIALNLSVVAFCILFMLYYRRFKVLAWMILLAILPSLANYWAVQLHGELRRQSCLERGLCDSLYRPCLCFLYFPKRASFVLGSKGVITVLGLCLDCGIQFLPPYPARNQVSQGSLPITWSRTACLVALDLQQGSDDGL